MTTTTNLKNGCQRNRTENLILGFKLTSLVIFISVIILGM